MKRPETTIVLQEMGFGKNDRFCARFFGEALIGRKLCPLVINSLDRARKKQKNNNNKQTKNEKNIT